MTQHLDIAISWLVCIFAALCGVCARVARDLWSVSSTAPTEPLELHLWQRRRRWMIWSELAALPFFATISISLVVYQNVPVVVGILIATVLGGLGFGFLLNGLQQIIRKRLGIEP